MSTRPRSAAAEHVRAVAEGRDVPDYARLPEDVDVSRLVETHDVDPDVPEPRSIWATPDLAAMARTNALGGL